jgi:HEAT repeat protein
MSDEEQLDLFAVYNHTPSPRPTGASPLVIGVLDDEALVAALAGAGMLETVALAVEAGRRGLAGALPALEAAVRRHRGFGASGLVVPEQAAAFEALSAIGGAGAARIVEEAILRGDVCGATLEWALAAAATLGVRLPMEASLACLNDERPAIRAHACRCARVHPRVLDRLLALLEDADFAVRTAAACVLGGIGRIEALPALWSALAAAPTAQVIEALVAAGDNDTLIRLGRWARERPRLREPIVAALAELDDPLARKILRGLGSPS